METSSRGRGDERCLHQSPARNNPYAATLQLPIGKLNKAKKKKEKGKKKEKNRTIEKRLSKGRSRGTMTSSEENPEEIKGLDMFPHAITYLSLAAQTVSRLVSLRIESWFVTWAANL